MSSELLLTWEVGCEEIPAWACEQIAEQVSGIFDGEMADARLYPLEPTAGADRVVVPEKKILVGPRRFAVQVRVLSEAPELVSEKKGPAEKAPDKAKEGFARSLGLSIDQLELRDGLLWGTRHLPSEPFSDAFPRVAERVLNQLRFAKPMRWGDSAHRFVRPVRWITTLLGDTPIEYEVWGVRSSGVTRTHRFLGEDRTASIASADAYAATLRSGSVVVDQAERRATIVSSLDAAAAESGGGWEDPAGVLSEVVHLVEWPTVLTGHFDTKYLELPERVLVTAMQSHQRYFPVRAAGGGLAPAFLTVMNGDVAAVDSILPGYERVLAGRLDDAVFSFERDRERGLDDMATSLASVVFHAKAGSLEQRRDRIVAVACTIGEQLGADIDHVRDAARLAKADQVSYVVQEFAELEGFAGSLYASAGDYPADVCAAIDQQFRPRSATADLPDNGVPAIVALADKFELLATMFVIGEQPTGSRDPHGLRRAAIGITRIVLEHDLQLDVPPIISDALRAVREQGIGEADTDLGTQLWEFILDRVEKRLTDDGIRIDAVRAARRADLSQLQHVDGLARAFHAAVSSGDENFLAVATAVNRCAKLLEKAGEGTDTVDPSVFEVDSERELHQQLAELAGPISSAVADRQFSEAVAHAAKLGPAVDAFFDREAGVMIMADDAKLRDNRLALLRRVLAVLAPLGDVSELQLS